MSFWHNDFKFKSIEDGLSLINYRGESQKVKIPSHVDGKPVAEIGKGAFENEVNDFDRLTFVVIPNSVEKIGDWAFAYNDLTEVTIPNSVTKIGVGAFFRAGNNLTRVSLPDDIEEIGNYAFGKYTEQIIKDYKQNNRQAATYTWNEEKQEWQNQLKQMLNKNCEENINRLLDKKEESFKITL